MKQMNGVLADVNLSSRPVKLVKCLGVHNEESWIEYNLKNCYKEFDIIRVVEGAVEGRPKSTPDGHSTDKTLEMIRSFPDPDNKIELYTQKRFFKSLEEQKQIFIDAASDGEWLFIIDCDEFYHPEDVRRVRRAIEARPAASEFIPTFLHFYRDFGHIRDYHPEWNLWHQRIIRYRDGLKYHTHPVATDGEGKCTYFAPDYQLNRYMLPNLYIYHYGHVKSPEFHKMKQEFYKAELLKFKLEDGTSADVKFDEKLLEFINCSEDLDSVLEFTGTHPAELSTHPLAHFHHPHYEGKKLTNWKEVDAYTKKMPTIPQLMYYDRRYSPFMNILEV